MSHSVTAVTRASDLERFSGAALYQGFDLPAFDIHAPTEHLVVLDGGVPAARASIWARSLPLLEGLRAGAVGHYAASTEAAASLVLERACARLRELGCETAVGPIDGTTWRRYRFVTERFAEPPFFLEPDNPDSYPGQFAAAGFAPLAGYTSALTRDLSAHDPRLDRVTERMDAAGVRVRALDATHLDDELARIHEVSLLAFEHAFLYTPVSREEFVAQYRAIIPYVDAKLVLIAEDAAGRAVGYGFGVPDLAQARRGRVVDTVIVKTVAVVPGREFAGLGGLIVERLHGAGRDLGLTRAIHALMHESNNSRNLSGHYAETIRRYTLYSKGLDR
jgi:L-amino acid N-acyltransferase YncA